MVHPHNGTLFSLKKKENSDTGYNVSQPWEFYAEWTKPDTKGKKQIKKTKTKKLSDLPNPSM